jgi:hypothetical protein
MVAKAITDLTLASALAGTELIEVSQLSTSVRISAGTLSAQASDNSYNDSGSGFISAGFAVNDRVNVAGFTGNTVNNIVVGVITALTASKMTIGGTDGDVIVDDAAGETVVIAKWTSRRVALSSLASILSNSWKQAVRVATTANGTLASAYENGDTVDGVTLATGDRILLKNQTTASENGIYTVNASGAPTRATDANTGALMVNAAVLVSEGTANADTAWNCVTNAPITLGSTSLSFSQISGAGGGASVTISTTAPGSPSTGNLWYNPENGGLYIYYNDGSSSQWVQIGGFGVTTQARLIGMRIITATGAGTYTPTAGTNSVVVQLVGGGAGGGGVAASSGGTASLAPGGQAGGFVQVRLSSGFSGATYSVGAKGTGGTAGNTAGTDGADTTFTTTTATTYTAKGGKNQTAGGGPFSMPFLRSGVSSLNATTGGDIAIDGGAPGNAFALSHFNVVTSPGGASQFSKGAPSYGVTSTATPAAATGYGGGGGGAASENGGGSAAGGDGSNGIIIIQEYA